MNYKIITSVLLVCVLLIVGVGLVAAAPQDPAALPTSGQGTLLIQTQGNEITVAKDGVGYNIHAFSALRLVVAAGQNDFDYFCGNTKYFIGGVQVEVGQTTTVTLQPSLCVNPTVSQASSKSSGSDAEQAAYAAGFLDGLYSPDCQNPSPNANYSSNLAEQAAYNEGYGEGFGGKCNGVPWQVSEAYNSGILDGQAVACNASAPVWASNPQLQAAYVQGFNEGLASHCP